MRALYLVLISLLIAASFTGCGKTEKVEQTPEATEQAVEIETEENVVTEELQDTMATEDAEVTEQTEEEIDPAEMAE